MLNRAALSIVIIGLAILQGCNQTPKAERKEGTGHVILKPLPEPAKYTPFVRRLVYVPGYSSIYWGFDQQTTQLSVTLSIRNANLRDELVIHSIKYFDSEGVQLREYVAAPSTLSPMATADFVVQRQDTAGGPGANFLVDWSSATDRDDPVIEAVMLGQHGNASISFTSSGRTLAKASPQ